MKRDVMRLTAPVCSVFNFRASRVQQRSGTASPIPPVLLVALLVLILGPDSVARADLLDGLQLHVEFEDNVFDSSPNGFDGQSSGDLQYASGVIGQAASFDGVDDKVLFPAFTDALIGQNDFTFAYWFNVPSGTLRSVLGKRRICALDPFIDIRMGPTRTMGLEVSTVAGNYFVGTPAVDSGWHHVAFTRAGTDLQAFLNGQLVDQMTTSAALDFSNTTALGLSSSPCIDSTDGTKMLMGDIDDLRIYNRVLTDFEIATLGGLFSDGFESSDTSAWSSTVQ